MRWHLISWFTVGEEQNKLGLNLNAGWYILNMWMLRTILLTSKWSVFSTIDLGGRAWGEAVYGQQIKYILCLCLSEWKSIYPQGCSDSPTCLSIAEQGSVEDINLNISHAWGTPHWENKLAHPCVSWGRCEALKRGGAERDIILDDVMRADCRLHWQNSKRKRLAQSDAKSEHGLLNQGPEPRRWPKKDNVCWRRQTSYAWVI